MSEKIEFKVQRDPYVPWEELPVLFTGKVDNIAEANRFAYGMSVIFGQEVRWNYTWSNQGHYVNAKYEEI